MQQSIRPDGASFSERVNLPWWHYYDLGSAGMLVHCSTEPLTIEQLEQLRRVATATASTGGKVGVPSAAEAQQMHTWGGEQIEKALFTLAQQKLDQMSDCTQLSHQGVLQFWVVRGKLQQRWHRLPEAIEEPAGIPGYPILFLAFLVLMVFVIGLASLTSSA